MANTKTPRHDSYVVVATKIHKTMATALDVIAKNNETTIYELLQNVCALFVKMMGNPDTLSAELASAIRLFEHIMQYPDSMNLADPTVQYRVKQAIYFVGAKGKSGAEPVLVTEPFMSNEAEVDYNVQRIIEAFLQTAAPSIYRRLVALGVDLECNSLYETLDKVIDMAGADPNEAEIVGLFQDNQRSQSGRLPVSSPYKRHPNRNMETLNLFANEQEQDL